jgi:hypothetical protein
MTAFELETSREATHGPGAEDVDGDGDRPDAENGGVSHGHGHGRRPDSESEPVDRDAAGRVTPEGASTPGADSLDEFFSRDGLDGA